MVRVRMSAERTTPIPTCRVAIVGAQRQRVARVAAIIHADEYLAQVDTLLSISDLPSQDDPSSSLTPTQLPIGVPSQVKIEYLPCVATFDSYEDENGTPVRYLSRLEYHGPNGTLVNGKTMAPFFDDQGESITNDDDGNNDDDDEIPNPFPGIAAVAIGCGVDTDDDVAKVKMFLDALSSSCTSQTADDHNMNMIIECVQPNQEFSSMKEENDAFRDMSDEMKKEAVKNRTIGPGKMANFIYGVAQKVVSQRWQKELSTHATLGTEQEATLQEEDKDDTAPELVEMTEVPHVIDPEKTRYSCKRCRSILFGADDLEDPPHAQSLHNFRKRGQSSSSGMCQNLFIAEPLPWMHGCGEMEGKLHCPKCNTKVGHYCWTGAQCSCGTWVTPAILVPVSKVDEMKPISQEDISGGSMLFARPNAMQINLQD